MAMTEEDFKRRNREEMEEEYRARSVNQIFFGVPFWLLVDTWWLGRPLVSSFLYSVCLAFVGGLLVGTMDYLAGSHLEPRSWRSFVQWGKDSRFGMMLTIFLAFGYYAIGAGIHDLFVYLTNPAQSHTVTVLIGIIGTLTTGIVLFLVRLKKRLLYGLSEIMVGVLIASYRVTASTNGDYLQPEFLLALLSAGVYLVVRGMDNIHQAVSQRAEEKLQSAKDVDVSK